MSDQKEKLFKYIEKLSKIELSLDPVEDGLTAFNEKIAEISNRRSKVAVLSNKITRSLFEAKRKLSVLEDTYTLKFDKLMAYDKRVKRCSNKGEMESTCRSILREETRAVNVAKSRVNELEAYEQCVDNCIKTLQHAKESISKQLAIINHQMNLGEIDRVKFADT